MKKYMILFLAFMIMVTIPACSKTKLDNPDYIGESAMPIDNSTTDDSDNPDDNSIKNESRIRDTNSIHYALDGVYVDFGCLLEEGDELTVKKVEPTPPDVDVKIYAYDFRLSSGQPDGAIEIVIPYNDEGLDEKDEHLSVCGKYLNEQTKQWEDVFYTVDTEVNEVHIITDHLSIFSAFTISNPKKRNEYISEVNAFASYMTSEQAQLVLNSYAGRGDYWQADVVGAFLDTTGTIPYFAETNVHTLLTLGEAYDDLVTKPFQNAMTGLSISTACTQLAYDIYDKGVHTNETAAGALKSSLNIAINFATPSIKLAYVSVGVIDMALTEVQTYTVAERYKSTKNMYDAYYKRPLVRRNHADWRKLFETIYKKNKDQPQAALDLMRAEIDRYVNEYWEFAGSDWSSWIEAYDKNAKLAKYPWPYKSDRENISSIHKKNIYDDLQALFNTMCRNMYLDSMNERQKEYEKLAGYYNRQFSIVISENIESGEDSTWADCYARLVPLSSKADPSSWTGKLNREGGGRISFTLLAHQKAGFPMTLELYRTLADINSGNKLRTIQLKPFYDNEQTVLLQPRELSEAEDSELAEATEQSKDTASEDNQPENNPPNNNPEENKPPENNPPRNNPPDNELPEKELTENDPSESEEPDTTPPIAKLPVQEANPWYDVTIVSADIERPKAFTSWYAILAYPEESAVELDKMYGTFNRNGKCILYFQESDYEGLESPSKIWLYKSDVDLLAGKDPDVIVNFSIGSRSYEGERDGEAVYSILVKAKPPEDVHDMLNAISGTYSSFMTHSEMYIPGEGLMEIDQKKDYAPYEQPSANVWLHYNGPSLTLKSDADPNNTEHVLDKLTDSRYELVYDNNGTTVKHSILIYSAGSTAEYTFESETKQGTRYLYKYYLYR